MTLSEPSTEAGRALHNAWHDGGTKPCDPTSCYRLNEILAIEAEARTQVAVPDVAELRAALARWLPPDVIAAGNFMRRTRRDITLTEYDADCALLATPPTQALEAPALPQPDESIIGNLYDAPAVSVPKGFKWVLIPEDFLIISPEEGKALDQLEDHEV